MLTVDCRRKLCGYFDELFSIYNSAVIGEGSFKVSAGDSLHVVEAFRYIGYLRILEISALSDEIILRALDLDVYALFYSMVITELPADQAKLALEKLCLPVVTPLQVRFVSF